METVKDVRTHILLKVADDPEFRQRMVADPKSTIAAEIGMQVPDDQMVFVNQAIEQAQAQDATPLSHAELTQVSGGRDEDIEGCTPVWDPVEDCSQLLEGVVYPAQ